MPTVSELRKEATRLKIKGRSKMKKSELKKILKPLIKECIREVIFEEGALSTIISEVVRGTTGSKPILENRVPK